MHLSSLSRSAIFACIGICFGIHNAAIAQPTATPEAPATTNTETPRLINFVRDDGVFQKKFGTLKEALEASRGSPKNNILKTERELVFLNSRCDPVTGISYSLTRPLWADIEAPVKSYFDRWDANPDARPSEEQALVNEIQKLLAVKWFPRKAECDAIPVMLSIGNYDGILLETDDAQNPLVGAKLNDGMMYASLTEDNPFADRVRAGEKDPKFLNKYGYNRFFDAQTAVNGALLQKTTNKLLIYDGKKISLYKFGNFSPDYNKKGAEFDAQFDIFKKARIRKGWTIVAVVLGQDKAIKINDPVAP